MAYYLSKTSTERLGECDRDLQKVFREVIKYIDFSVICGFRDENDQNEAYLRGNSSKKWPNSRHNNMPSTAIDVAPYPIDWDDLNSFYRLNGVIMTIAQQMNIKLIWGASFTTLVDLPHYQLK